MNKTVILLLLALCSFAAVPQTLSLAANLGSAAYTQRAGDDRGSRLRLDEVGAFNAAAEGPGEPTPIRVVLVGVAVVCFIAVRRLS